jgi:hypothetical protein
MKQFKPDFKAPEVAFGDAIAAGCLSADPAHPLYAGMYMYMYTDAGRDMFKNIDTREYRCNPPRLERLHE